MLRRRLQDALAVLGILLCASQALAAAFTLSASPPPVPTNLTSICNSTGDQVTVSWSAVSGAESYYLRMDNTVNPRTFPDPATDHYLDQYPQTAFTGAVIPGQAYHWWVHGANNPAGIGLSTHASFICQPTPTTDTTAPRISSVSASVTLPAVKASGGRVLVFPPSETSPTVVIAPDGTQVEVRGSVTSGLQEAINYASEQGYDLHVYGGTQPATGGAVVYQIGPGVTLTFPAMQGKRIVIDAATINCAGSASDPAPCLLFDSHMMVDVEHRGGQVVSSRGGPIVVFRPMQPVPVDRIPVTTASSYSFTAIAGVPEGASPTAVSVLFDVAAGSFGIVQNRFLFNKVNGGREAGIRVTTPAPGASFAQNQIVATLVHGLTGSAWALQLGTGDAPSITNNVWQVNVSDPRTSTTRGLSTWGDRDTFLFSNNSPIRGAGVQFERTADFNRVVGNQVSGTVTDASTALTNRVETQQIRQTWPVTVAGSPFTYLNRRAREVDVEISGGVVQALAFTDNAGVSWRTLNLTQGRFRLSPGSGIRVISSVPPAMYETY